MTEYPPDLETISWISPILTYISAPVVEPPTSLQQALGYRVEVRSREEDAEVGDM